MQWYMARKLYGASKRDRPLCYNTVMNSYRFDMHYYDPGAETAENCFLAAANEEQAREQFAIEYPRSVLISVEQVMDEDAI